MAHCYTKHCCCQVTTCSPLFQACHDMVPPDWLQPVLRHLCNQFIHDRARPEEITTGLRTVRELCVRMPLVMTHEMLQVSFWCGVLGLGAQQHTAPSASARLRQVSLHHAAR